MTVRLASVLNDAYNLNTLFEDMRFEQQNHDAYNSDLNEAATARYQAWKTMTTTGAKGYDEIARDAQAFLDSHETWQNRLAQVKRSESRLADYRGEWAGQTLSNRILLRDAVAAIKDAIGSDVWYDNLTVAQRGNRVSKIDLAKWIRTHETMPSAWEIRDYWG